MKSALTIPGLQLPELAAEPPPAAALPDSRSGEFSTIAGESKKADKSIVMCGPTSADEPQVLLDAIETALAAVE